MLHFLVGLGTSSILGGCNLAALFRAMGEEHDHDSLIYAVSKMPAVV